MRRTRKKALFIVCGYGFLWLLTWTWGRHDVDRDFDRSFFPTVMGRPGAKPARVEVPNVRNPLDPVNRVVPPPPWRFRSRGFAIAPFVIVDEVAYADDVAMAGAGVRVVIWVFGFVWSIPAKTYWVS